MLIFCQQFAGKILETYYDGIRLQNLKVGLDPIYQYYYLDFLIVH